MNQIKMNHEDDGFNGPGGSDDNDEVDDIRD